MLLQATSSDGANKRRKKDKRDPFGGGNKTRKNRRRKNRTRRKNSKNKKILKKLRNYYNKFKNRSYIEKFLEDFNKNIFKSDIYALGRVFEDICGFIKVNSKIKKLINNMVILDHEKRFNIEECLNYLQK